MNTTKLSLVSILAIAAFMIAAATVVPGNNAMAHHKNKHKFISIGNTETTAIQAADNSQHASFGAGSTGNTATNSPVNVQSQSVNSGSSFAG
ncbi:MAG TPA: hypothetical protein VJ729_17790 [Nitrososphaeraceae archaeon]|nr:hypothetical protein [Nitrososphaeraceae archaeon]